jgi:hypothetical protein
VTDASLVGETCEDAKLEIAGFDRVGLEHRRNADHRRLEKRAITPWRGWLREPETCDGKHTGLFPNGSSVNSRLPVSTSMRHVSQEEDEVRTGGSSKDLRSMPPPQPERRICSQETEERTTHKVIITTKAHKSGGCELVANLI